MASAPREKVVIEQQRRVLKRRRCWFVKTTPGQLGAIPGQPDWMVCYRGLFLGIEAKRPTASSRQSAAQKIQEDLIIRAGGIYAICRSAQDVEGLLDRCDALLASLGVDHLGKLLPA
jgi:hypothetical protein